MSNIRINRLKYQEYKCFYCKRDVTSRNATIDHIIPVSKGGVGLQFNKVIACTWCNCRKANLNADLFVKWVRSLRSYEIGSRDIKFVPEQEKHRRFINKLKTLKNRIAHGRIKIDVKRYNIVRNHKLIRSLKGKFEYLAKRLKRKFNGMLHQSTERVEGRLLRKRRFEAGKSCLDKQQRFFTSLFN